jgi:tRNA pseudouridine55 synthase
VKLGEVRVGVDGILNILKPEGKTSFEIVSWLRRLSGERRVGHAGTLDPEASGVLVVCLGQGTRIIEFLAKASKTYRAEIELGIATDTYDASGTITHRGNPFTITEEQTRQVLRSFSGPIEQIPPMYSALKYKGRRLYRLAREGIKVDRKPRQVQILRLEMLNWQSPLMTIEVECSAGTYIRSLAQDIGVALGCGAHLKKLVRLKSEPFHIVESIPLSPIEEAFHQGYEHCYLYTIDEVILNWRAIILGGASEALVRQGRSISMINDADYLEDWCRAYSADGHFLAVLHKEGELWHPEKVFR